MHTDVEDLLRKLQDGTSDECCFDNHNITTGSLVFEIEGDTVATVQPFFVSLPYIYAVYECNEYNNT